MTIELSNFFNNPTLIELGPLKIQYYAVTWLLSALLIYVFLKNNRTIKEIGLNKDEVNDMVFLYGLFFGAICGGRVGYMFIYGSEQLMNNPLSLFYVWQGGLSFHGGLIGVIFASIIFAKKNKQNPILYIDIVAIEAPVTPKTSAGTLSSKERHVATIWMSSLIQLGNRGLIGRSMSLEIKVALSGGRPSRRMKLPGILPAA